jgi:hypothetical protein
MEDLTGKQLGPYRIVALFGEGGMAAVFKAYQPSTDRFVALKVLPRNLAHDPQFMQRFSNEARVLARLQHPHILQVHDTGQAEGYTYIVMPLIETGTLADRLKGRPLTLKQLRTVGMQVGEALDYAHSRGLVHRDVKPSNVLMDERGNCLLTDFGIARIIEGATKLTGTGTVMGTPAYMSPEQGRGQVVDRRSDIYSLGVILFELATGRQPFIADHPVAIIVKHATETVPAVRGLNPNVPMALEQVIQRAMAKNPADRYQTARELVDAIDAAVVDTGPRSVVPETVIEPPPGTGVGAGGLPPGGQLPGGGTAGPGATAALPARGLLGGALLGLTGLGLVSVIGVGLVCLAVLLLPRMLGGGSATQTQAAGTADALTAIAAIVRTPEATDTPREPTPTRTRPPPTRTRTPTATRTPIPATPTSASVLPGGETERASVAFGPFDGALAGEEDGFIETWSSGVNLRDFVASADFVVPDTAIWDFGYLFRHVGPNNQYRVIVERNGTWTIRNQVDDASEILAQGTVDNVNTQSGAVNTLTLGAIVDRGFLIINGALAGQFDLGERQDSGDIMLSTEMITGNEVAGATNAFRGFTVWRAIVPGGGSGSVRHEDDGFVEEVSSEVNMRDFVAVVNATNPYQGDWDLGFFFRLDDEGTGYRIFVESGGNWYLSLRQGGEIETMDSGPVSNLNTAQGGTNSLFVLVHGRLGVLYVNGLPTAEFNVGDLLAVGDVSLGTGFFEGYERPGAATAYRGYAVWVVP